MLIFFDESFRKGVRGHKFGVLSGVAIPEELFGRVMADVYSMKYSSFGESFAKDRELKGSKLLKAKNFRESTPEAQAARTFVFDLLRYIRRERFVTFGVVCFDTKLQSFKCADPLRLDVTYRALFERIDGFMNREFPSRFAKIIFDDVDYGSNKNRAESITNYFNRTAVGRGYDRIIRTPFFAVSQSQSVGVQLADVVTAVFGMRFQGIRDIMPFWGVLKDTIYRYPVGNRMVSTVRVFRGA